MIVNYQAMIDDWVKKHVLKNALIFVWQGNPNTSLIKYVQHKYPGYSCYWLIFCENSALEIDDYFVQTYPHLKNIVQVLNPIGTSVFQLSPKNYLWITLHTDYQKFLADFDYDSRLICNLNVFNWKSMLSPQPKPWYRREIQQKSIQKVVIVGAGIAGTMTAHFLADEGIRVVIVDTAAQIASQASGHYQGIMYAKVSAFETLQTELLYKSYGLSLTLLKLVDKNHHFSDHCGILHLDYNEKEKERNRNLAEKKYSLFRYLIPVESNQIAGIEINSGGLFWPYGAWVQPRLWIEKILQHPNIEVRTSFHVTDLQYHKNQWQVITEGEIIESDVVVLALGADLSEIYRKFGLNFYFISGQTSLVESNEYSQKLNIVLSGHSYFSPAYKKKHCYGATFHPNDKKIAWNILDDALNFQNLFQLSPQLHQSFVDVQEKHQMVKGHQAVRCDSFDHLPTAGALGDSRQMKNIYAKLRFDKNYHIRSECPYWPNLYVNTAHSSRGLLTASLCSLGVVSEILNLPNPLGLKLRQALSPNRLIINDIIKGQI